jgi:hypothetical protein
MIVPHLIATLLKSDVPITYSSQPRRASLAVLVVSSAFACSDTANAPPTILSNRVRRRRTHVEAEPMLREFQFPTSRTQLTRLALTVNAYPARIDGEG